MPRLFKRASARRDLVEHAVYLAAEGGEELRKWPVKDFESFLIFYLPHERGVTIVRVLYGHRDWWRMLGVV